MMSRGCPRCWACSYSDSTNPMNAAMRVRPFVSLQRNAMRLSLWNLSFDPRGIRLTKARKSLSHVTTIVCISSPSLAMTGSAVPLGKRSRTSCTSWPRPLKKSVTDSGTFSSTRKRSLSGVGYPTFFRSRRCSNRIAALTSWGLSRGYSLMIASVSNPACRNRQTAAVGIRVPARTGALCATYR